MRKAITTSPERVRELLTYCPDCGEFFWNAEARSGFHKSAVQHRRGDRAGTRRRSDGRSVIRLDGRLYLGYRLAWAYMTGEWPAHEIDHVDGNKTNDIFSNLREAPRRMNQENIRRPQKNKTSCTLLGVFPNKRGGRLPWRASITTHGKQISLGTFASQDEAYTAYLSAKRKLHEGCTL